VIVARILALYSIFYEKKKIKEWPELMRLSSRVGIFWRSSARDSIYRARPVSHLGFAQHDSEWDLCASIFALIEENVVLSLPKNPIVPSRYLDSRAGNVNLLTI
jgi:hypothetical protein